MKILVISPVYPYPPHDGDRIRIYSFLKRLAKRHTIRVVTFAGIRELTKPLDFKCNKIDVIRIGRGAIMANAAAAFFSGKSMNVVAYNSREMAEAVKKADAEFKPDIVYCYRIRTAPYAALSKAPAVIDIVDSLGLYLERQSKAGGSLFRKIYAAADKKRVLKFERELEGAFRQIFINAEEDAAYLKISGIITAPNGAEIPDVKRGAVKSNPVYTVGYFGDFNYAPNRQGLDILLKKIWKKHYKSDKSIRLIIAGRNAPAAVNEAGNVIVKGYVPDLEKEIKSWDVSVAPVFYGAGRQNKVLLSWACKVPVIASDFAARGVYGENGKNLLSAASPDGIKECIEKLRKNRALGARLAHNGKLTLLKYFNWDRSAASIERGLKNAVRRKK